MIRTLGVLSICAGAVALVGAATASAAKPEPFIIPLDCGEDGALEVRVNGGGAFAAAHIVGGGTLVPVAFTNQRGTFTDAEGMVTEFEDPDISRGVAPTNKDLLSCHFEGTFEEEDGTGTFEGDVDAFIVGKR